MRHQVLKTTPATSTRMARVHLKHGISETRLAKALWHRGFRYRLNYRRLPGSPDIAITKYKIAIFVDGEFWHGFDWIHRREKLKTNRDYWIAKIEENIARDARNDRRLRALGWLPIHFWERDVKADLTGCVETICDTVQEQIIALHDESLSSMPDDEGSS